MRLRQRSLDEEFEGYLTQCDGLAAERTCTHRDVGAIVVRDSTIIGVGRNHVPRNAPRCISGGCERGKLPPGEGAADYRDCPAVHAEIAALVCAGNACDGAVMYVNSRPCDACRKSALALGIKRITFRHQGAILHYGLNLSQMY